jgi:CRP/FNR family transcriptional regulator, anaerobic regulatory protein
METLIERLNAIYPLSGGLQSALQSRLQEKPFHRKHYLPRSGQTCRNMYFIENGLCRAYQENGGKEFSSRFFKEGDLCIAPQSYFSQSISEETIIAVEDSVTNCLSFIDVEHIRRTFLEFNYILLALVLKDYLLVDQCLSSVRMHPASDRYTWLKDCVPWLTKRISGKHLATYLGMTDVMLSRVKEKR